MSQRAQTADHRGTEGTEDGQLQGPLQSAVLCALGASVVSIATRCTMIAVLLALASACSSTPQRREAEPGMQVVSLNRRLVREVAGQYQLFLPRDYSSSAERWP